MEQNMNSEHYYRATLFRYPDDALPMYYTFRSEDVIAARNHTYNTFPGCEIEKIERVQVNKQLEAIEC